MTNATKGKICKISAVVIDVAVPLIATLMHLPIWVERSSRATVSGLFLIFAFLSCIPFLKQILAYFKSPAVWVMWCIFFVLFVALRNIIDEMVIICFAGLIANIIGAVIYKIGKNLDPPNGNSKGGV